MKSGNVIIIKSGVGDVAFRGVVALTMFAAETFDPRLSMGRSPTHEIIWHFGLKAGHRSDAGVDHSSPGHGQVWRTRSNECRRHEIPTAKNKITNSPHYDTAMVGCASLAIWFTEEAIAAWHTPAAGKRSGQLIYPALAIETAFAIRPVFHQPLRPSDPLLGYGSVLTRRNISERQSVCQICIVSVKLAL